MSPQRTPRRSRSKALTRLQPDVPPSAPGQTRRARRAENALSVASSATGATRAEMRRATSVAVAAAPVIGSTLAAQAATARPVTATAETAAAVGAPTAQPVREAPVRVRSRRELRAATGEIALSPLEASAPEVAVAEGSAPEGYASQALGVEASASGVGDEVSVAADDAFDIAARVFSFTAETPIVPAAAEADGAAPADEDDASPEPASAAADGASAEPVRSARRRRRARARVASAGSTSPVRRVAAASFTVGVMGAVGLLAVGMGAPAEAVAAAVKSEPVTSIQAPSKDAADDAEIQAYVAPAGVDVDLSRESETYSMASLSEIAASVGITRHTNFFVNDPNGQIQWPFAVGVPISDGYGPRWGGMHNGLDFTPGEGAEIQAVAAGTVRIANESGGAFGVHVMIDHEIDGEVFSTHYAHMQYGSIMVTQGQHVEAGTILGLVGDTGLSYGAHLHFEVYIGESRIDPLPWLREHAGG